jgi:hypothetical protein
VHLEIVLLLVTPLILSIVQQPAIAATLLGIPAQFSWPSLHIVRQQLLQYVGFSSPSSGTRISPAYGLGIVALALVGLYHLLTAKYTAKSYILTIWFLLLLPSIVSNPDAVMVTFVPVLLLVAYGIDYIIRSWYRLFPTNPYARVFGLIPLSVLVFGLIFSGVERFVYGYHYDPRSSGAFSNDLQLLDSVVDANKNKPILVVVPESMREFYTVYSDRKPVTPRVQVASALNSLPGGSWALRHSDLSDFSYNDLRVHQGRVEFYCKVIGMKGWYEIKPRDVMGIEFQPIDSKQRPIPWKMLEPKKAQAAGKGGG